MIALTKFVPADAWHLLRVLHPVSQEEIEEANLPEICAIMNEIGHLTTGWHHGEILFIAGSAAAADEPNKRGTLFVFAKGHDAAIALGLRRWAEAEKKRFPEAVFWVNSEGDHPLKHRFLAIAGCNHVDGSTFVACS